MTRDDLAQRLDELVGWLRFNRVSICGLEAGDIAAKAADELRRPAAAEVEDRAGSLVVYADGVAKLAETSKTDDGWLRALANALRDTADLLRRLSPSPTEEGWRPIETVGRKPSEVIAAELAVPFFTEWQALHEKAAENNLKRFTRLVSAAIQAERDLATVPPTDKP